MKIQVLKFFRSKHIFVLDKENGERLTPNKAGVKNSWNHESWSWKAILEWRINWNFLLKELEFLPNTLEEKRAGGAVHKNHWILTSDAFIVFRPFGQFIAFINAAEVKVRIVFCGRRSSLFLLFLRPEALNVRLGNASCTNRAARKKSYWFRSATLFSLPREWH